MESPCLPARCPGGSSVQVEAQVRLVQLHGQRIYSVTPGVVGTWAGFEVSPAAQVVVMKTFDQAASARVKASASASAWPEFEELLLTV